MSDRQKVSIELNVEQAAAVQGWLAAQGSMVQYENQLGKVQKASERASKSSKDGWDQTGKSITALLGKIDLVSLAWQGVTTAMAMARKEFEDKLSRAKEAADAQLGLAGARQRAFDALGPGAELTPGQLAQRFGMDPRTWSAGAAALKEGGPQMAGLAATTAEEAVRMQPHMDDAERAKLAAGAVDLQKQRPDLSPSQAIAQLMQASRGSESGVGAVADTIVPAMGRVGRYAGGNTATFAAFFRAMQDTMNTEIGPATSAGEKAIKTLAVEGKFAAGTPLEEMIARAKGDSRLRGKVLGRVGRNEAAYPAIKEMLEGGATFDLFQQFAKDTGGTPAEVAAREEGFRKSVMSAPGQLPIEIAEFGKRLKQGTHADPRDATAGALDTFMAEQQRDIGVWAWDRQENEARRWYNTRFQQDMSPEEQINYSRETLRKQAQMVSKGQGFSAAVFGTEGEKRAAERLLESLDAKFDLLIQTVREGQQKPTQIELPPNAAARPVPAQALRE